MNLGATFIGNLMYAASQWFLLIILARLGDAGEVGLFALGLAITAPIFTFTGLDLGALQASDASQRYRFVDYLGLRCLSLPVAVGVSLTIALLMTGHSPEVLWVIAAVTLSKSVEAIGLVAYGLYNRVELMHLTASSLILRGWMGAAAFGMVYGISEDLALSVVALAGAWAAVIVAVDGRRVMSLLRRESATLQDARRQTAVIWPRMRWSAVRSLFYLSLPAAVSTTVATLTVQTPRYALEVFADTAALGVFASLAYSVRVVEMISGAMGTAMLPRLAKHYVGERTAALSRLLLRMIAGAVVLGLAAILVAILVGDSALRLLYGPEFARGDVLVRLFVASLFIMVAKLLGAALMGMRVLKLRMAIFICSLALAAIMSILLIPSRGIIGAAEALVVAFAWRCLASGVLVYYYLGRSKSRPQQTIPGALPREGHTSQD